MARSKNPGLTKHTLNLRKGDLDKLKEIFPAQQPTVMARKILSAFVDKHYSLRVEHPSLDLNI